MTMTASEVGTIPASGFTWYILYFEDNWTDSLNTEFQNNFLELGKQVGPKVLVIQGFDPDKFFASAKETPTLENKKWQKLITRPALLISDTAPRLMLQEPAKLKAAKLILIPLAPLRDRPPGTVVELLRNLVAALRDDKAVWALQRLSPGELQKGWGWLRQYAELKPNFLGFGVNLNAVLNKVLSGPASA